MDLKTGHFSRNKKEKKISMKKINEDFDYIGYEDSE